MAEDSWRRPLVLGLCAAVPVALVTGWLVFGGSGDGQSPSAAASKAASVVEKPIARDDASSAAPDRAPGREAGKAGEGLASLAERQQELMDARADAERRSASDRLATLRGDGDGGPEAEEDEESYSPGEDRSGPTPEEVEELQRLTALGTPSDAELQALMENEPPMPSPEEIAVLRRRTADLLDFPEDLVREVRESSENAQPSDERLQELRDRRQALRDLQAETP